MFRVVNKETGELVIVYNVRDDICGYPQFLVYEDGQWKYKSAKHYKEEEEPEMTW